MELGAIILILVGVVAFFAYRKGKQAKEVEVLEDEIKSNKERRRIANLSNDNLDDELREYWD